MVSTPSVTFSGGTRTLLGFGAVFALVTVLWVPLTAAVADAPAWLRIATDTGKFVVILGAVLGLLRMEEVGPTDLGFSRHHLGVASIAIGGLWVAVNAVGIGVAAAFGNEWGLPRIWNLSEAALRMYGGLPSPWVVLILHNFLVVGLVEELAFRGYFQTKVIALLGDSTRWQTAGSIVLASVLFGALHTPGAMFSGASIGGILGAAALPAITGLFFGAFYELTHNIYFVALLHGIGNTWPLVVDWHTWSGTAFFAFWIAVGIVYLGVTVGYRYWILDTDSPRGNREDTGERLLD